MPRQLVMAAGKTAVSASTCAGATIVTTDEAAALVVVAVGVEPAVALLLGFAEVCLHVQIVHVIFTFATTDTI